MTNSLNPNLPRPPAHIQPYVDVLSVDDTIRFLLAFGGAEMYLTATPKGRSKLAQMFGLEKATALAKAAENLPRRVPTAKPWIAQVWSVQGLAVAEIARRLHVSDVSVRMWRKRAVETALNAPENDRQMRLFYAHGLYQGFCQSFGTDSR